MGAPVSEYVTASPSVIACDLDYAVVVVDYVSGRVRTLIGPSGRWWRELANSGDLAASNVLQGDHGLRLAEQFRTDGTLRRTEHPQPWPPPVSMPPWRPSWGTQEIPFALEPFPPTSASWTSLAAGSLMLTLAQQHVGPRHRRMARTVQFANAITIKRRSPASAEDVLQAVHAVRRVGRFSPIRCACLEESVAAVALLAGMGKSARWCHGLAAEPITLHAWVETLTGKAPAEPNARRYARLYTTPRRRKDKP